MVGKAVPHLLADCQEGKQTRMQGFFSALTWASMGLLVPCIALLLYFLLRALVLCGQEWRQHRTGVRLLDEIDALEAELLRLDFAACKTRLTALHNSEPEPLLQHLLIAMDVNASQALRERQVGDYALLGEAELATARLLIRLGPSLGLIGTLIPMGPALAGLANGDLVSLSQNMQVAFSTTVLGVLIGGIGFVLYQSRKQRIARGMHKLEFILHYVAETQANKSDQQVHARERGFGST